METLFTNILFQKKKHPEGKTENMVHICIQYLSYYNLLTYVTIISSFNITDCVHCTVYTNFSLIPPPPPTFKISHSSVDVVSLRSY